jgi:hypothetical protein
MSQQAHVRNPFMLLVNPEVVLAAIENSEHLGKLNSKMCRPLDGPATVASMDGAEDGIDEATETSAPASGAS